MLGGKAGISLFFLVLVFTNCKVTEVKPDASPGQLFVTSYTGYDAEDIARTCVAEDLGACRELSETQQHFAHRCEGLGYKVRRCSCEMVLCSDKKKPE
jgi:hypothetical protein